MKHIHKIALLMLLLLSASFAGKAQNKRLFLGVNLGGLSQTLPGIATGAKIGYQFGGDIQLGAKRFLLQPGLQYSVSHLGLSYPSLANKKTDLWVSGVKIPVMLVWKKIITHSANLRIFSGPSFMVVTTVKHRHMDNPSLLLTDKQYHDVEWAGHLGVGLDWSRFFIDLGFQKGLTYAFTGGPKAKTNLFYTNVGIRF